MNTQKQDLLFYKNLQERIFISLASILQSMASPVRLKIVHFLFQAPLPVEVLAKKIDQSVANTSMHLRKMHACNILQVDSYGQKRIYSLAASIFSFWEECQNLHSEIDPRNSSMSYSSNDECDWHLSLAETVDLILKNNLYVVDIKPSDEINTSTSMNHFIKKIPYDDFSKKSKQFDKTKPLLIICRGKYCALSKMATLELRKKKFKAYRFPYSTYKLEHLLEKNIKYKKMERR